MKQMETDYLEAVKAFSVEHNEPAWMTDLRQAALSKVDELALPKIEQMDYHRWPLFDVNFEVTEASGTVPAFDAMGDNPVIVQNDNTTVFEQLSVDLAEKGVIFTDLFSALTEYPELVKEYYMTKAVKATDDKLTAFNAAFMNSGLFLYVPKNVVIEEPLEAIFYNNGLNPAHYVKHILIVAEENSEFSYLERFQTIGEDSVKASANIVVEIIAKAGAKIKYSAVDRLGKNMTTYMNRRGYVMRDAVIDWALGVMNDGNVIADFDSDLVGDGAHADLKVVAISSGRQTQVIESRVTNQVSHTIGHILQHGVILDQATLTFNGIGHIMKNAKGSDAQQESRVLMLSDKAKGDANPILLIDENEVTAGHAASVGRVNPDEMYYLMSRGLRKEVAERLVIRGFLGPVITAIPVRNVQNEFVEVVEGKLKV
ncbi:Fe-S cluster assembly protein SufD [Enterococcus sp. PF1-24]|uniref:Fe-S cluster assembly protein SufD n=1 Tax=unclassified Enterococcus TaxID=2608891 RepID=UPI002475356E|nr:MULTISPECIES: Fe-S cluster assembly protein SufD [unclassified Enterococcus]MDH6365370.1 Fe-S cluster assembly protein SufD [Enterococcus sp. PFB1-1]MDH6402471.1 Fe-S cluster assembly protein SufD [Enterococcus sp. PF1-24]